MMNFQDLHAFFNVATEGSFAKAAVRLRIAQSALSRRVARLEQALGVSLLQRSGRGIMLTEHGVALVDRAKALMSELEQIERDILILAEEPTGAVRVAMPPMVSQMLGPQLVMESRQRFPQIDLQLWESFSDTIHDWISEGRIDLGLLFSSGRDSDLQLTPLLNEPLILVASADFRPAHAALVDGQVDVMQLRDIPLILPRRPNSLRTIVDRFAGQHGLTLNVVMEVDGVSATKGFVAAGVCCTIFSINGLHDPFNSVVFRAFRFRQTLDWELVMAQPARTRTPRAFIETERLIKQEILTLLQDGPWQGEGLPALME